MCVDRVSRTDQEFVLGNLSLPDPRTILHKAYVPEHSVGFMRCMSSGEVFLIQDHLFVAGEDWLLAIGYPLDEDYNPARFEQALQKAIKQARPENCWAVCPELPSSLAAHVLEQDLYYILDPWTKPGSRLLNLAGKAEKSLQVDKGRVFTAEHHNLWTEFTSSRELPSRVRNMFLRTKHVLAANADLVLLNAWDSQDNLAASLLLDTAPRRFLSYMIGAHSRTHYTPYATDLLFREMLKLARQQGKEFIHLGLGVNPGIRRFKRKWLGCPGWSYELAAWQERPAATVQTDFTGQTSQPVFLAGQDKWKFVQSLPRQRKLAMLWEVEKKGRRSWIVGAAHFCRFSFKSHLRKLFKSVDAVLCEGPLDRFSMELVSKIGKNPEPDAPRLAFWLSSSEIESLQEVVCGAQGFWARLLNARDEQAPDVYKYLAHYRHWLAFYGLWAAFLKRHGWQQSVDLEAWYTAEDMDKYVLGMESIPEQLSTLENIPVERILRFFRNCRQWGTFMRQTEKGYLKGDLLRMFGTSTEFPSRTELVIQRRDERFLQRMQPFMEQGQCAVFVGTAHMLNLRHLLRSAGFNVQRCS